MERMRDTTAITEGRADKMAKHNLFETSRFFADVYVLRPGQAQALHRHGGVDKCYFVLSGRGTVTSGADSFAVEPGGIVWCPAGCVRKTKPVTVCSTSTGVQGSRWISGSRMRAGSQGI